MGCIYIATNLIDGKKYIGLTRGKLSTRRKQHEKIAKYPSSKSHRLFHSALLQFGLDNFSWEVSFESDDLDELNRKEVELIDSLKTRVDGYNLTLGGSGTTQPLTSIPCHCCGQSILLKKCEANLLVNKASKRYCSPACRTEGMRKQIAEGRRLAGLNI